MKNLNSLFNFKFITLSLSFTSLALANQVNVSTTEELVLAALNSKAGDTIWVAHGEYELSGDLCTNDKFVNETGRDCGLIWLGNSGTKENPIVLVGKDPANPPDIFGKSVKSNYGIHVTGDYVILKNLKIHNFSKGVVFDNSIGSILEDCEVYHTGGEIIHVRDSSQNVTLNRNLIYGSGYDNPQYGEGIYIGTYHTGWASSQQSDKNAGYWGSAASQHRYSGYDWRVDKTQITCNVVKATTAENVDVKEGTTSSLIQGNMLVGDLLNFDGTVSHDDANIDMKGTSWDVKGNYFYNSKKSNLKYYNPRFKYYVEEVEMRGDNVKKYENDIGYLVTADKYAQKGWCDSSANDNNKCWESDNEVVETIREVRNDCKELFVIPEKNITYSNVDFDALEPERTIVLPNSSSSAAGNPSSSSGSVSFKNVRYEAEAAQWVGTMCEEKTHKDASGGKYIRTITDCDITFNINVPTAGTYDVVIRFSNTAENEKFQSIYANGVKVAELEFPVTLEGDVGGANAAFEDKVVSVSLNAGNNTFAIMKSWGHVDIDYIDVMVPVTSGGEPSFQTVKYEAESANYTGSTCELKTHATASGGKYIRTITDCDIAFNNVEVPTAGSYDIIIRFSNTAANSKKQYVLVNGVRVAEPEFPITLEGNVGGANAAFEDVVVKATLNAGVNKIAINKSWGHVDVDYIALEIPVTNAIAFNKASIEGFSIQTVGRTIQIFGANVGKQVAILDLQGRLLYSGRISNQNGFKFTVNHPGVFLVRIGSLVKQVKISR